MCGVGRRQSTSRARAQAAGGGVRGAATVCGAGELPRCVSGTARAHATLLRCAARTHGRSAAQLMVPRQVSKHERWTCCAVGSTSLHLCLHDRFKGLGAPCDVCLPRRIGENLNQVLRMPDWLCPVCRDICNCSGALCQRLSRNWLPTNQLEREAMKLGFASVRL